MVTGRLKKFHPAIPIFTTGKHYPGCIELLTAYATKTGKLQGLIDGPIPPSLSSSTNSTLAKGFLTILSDARVLLCAGLSNAEKTMPTLALIGRNY
jgi:hypothetical protein